MDDIIREGGFVPVSNQPYKICEHMQAGELHHLSVSLSKLCQVKGQVRQYVNSKGYVLLVPVK